MLQLDVAKTAFYQVESMEEESGMHGKANDEGYFDDEEASAEEEDKTNSRDVGHNIYILAHQVYLSLSLCRAIHSFLESWSQCGFLPVQCIIVNILE